jgi:hypothetical protein
MSSFILPQKVTYIVLPATDAISNTVAATRKGKEDLSLKKAPRTASIAQKIFKVTVLGLMVK